MLAFEHSFAEILSIIMLRACVRMKWLQALLLFVLAPATCLEHTVPLTFERGSDKPCGLLETSSFTLYSNRVVTSGGVGPASIEVKDGQIVAVRHLSQGDHSSLLEGAEILDYGDLVISPGLVDTHVHVNEPGRTEWEGFRTATRAAAAGGVTTVVDMPLNCIPPTTTLDALVLKRQVAAFKISVDVAFWGGLVPDNAADPKVLEQLFLAGAVGLKGFLCESGVPEFPSINASHIEAALPVLAKYKKPLVLHSELIPDFLLRKSHVSGDPRDYKTYLDSRPPEWEVNAVRLIIDLARSTAPGQPNEGARLHIVHLAAADCIPLIQSARKFGADLTAQACPHYLTFNSEAIPDGATEFKCSPPIREAKNREKLWEGLLNGEIDFLASDHSPSLPELKHLDDGNFLKAWGGVAGLQFDLPATWTAGQTHGITLKDVARWWSEIPANYVGLTKKGSIKVGKDADFVIWDPEAEMKVDDDFKIYHRYNVTPYRGLTLAGRVVHTMVRGHLVYSNGSFSPTPCGQYLAATLQTTRGSW